jgi:hypothetical protein
MFIALNAISSSQRLRALEKTKRAKPALKQPPILPSDAHVFLIALAFESLRAGDDFDNLARNGSLTHTVHV